jgi:hypothetical protein
VEICWVVQKDYDPKSDIGAEKMKELCTVWGSYKSWRQCQTDNCVVEDFSEARRLVDRDFNLKTNLWTHEENYDDLGRPEALSLHKITIDKTLQDKDDLVALALAGARYDLVMCIGFDISFHKDITDKLELHEHKRYLSAIANIVRGFDQTQFVFIDLPNDPAENFDGLENITCDNIQNVLTLVSEL